MRILRLFCAILSINITAAAANLKWKGKSGLIELTDPLFDEMTQVPRDYWTVILLTALGKEFNCVACAEFDPEFAMLAKSWRKQHPDGDNLYFGHLDFNKAQGTFRKLQLTTAPNMWIYPPTVGEQAIPNGQPIRYDFNLQPRGEPAAAFISANTGKNVKFTRPLDYVRFGKFLISVVAGMGALYAGYSVLGFIFTNKQFWAALSILSILIFNGGYMFTQIRNVPYKRGDGYIAGGFQEQFGAETQIVAGIYGILAVSTISLGISAPRIKDPRNQSIIIVVWLVLQFVVYSFLLQLFKQKNAGYPFKLLL